MGVGGNTSSINNHQSFSKGSNSLAGIPMNSNTYDYYNQGSQQSSQNMMTSVNPPTHHR